MAPAPSADVLRITARLLPRTNNNVIDLRARLFFFLQVLALDQRFIPFLVGIALALLPSNISFISERMLQKKGIQAYSPSVN